MAILLIESGPNLNSYWLSWRSGSERNKAKVGLTGERVWLCKLKNSDTRRTLLRGKQGYGRDVRGAVRLEKSPLYASGRRSALVTVAKDSAILFRFPSFLLAVLLNNTITHIRSNPFLLTLVPPSSTHK